MKRLINIYCRFLAWCCWGIKYILYTSGLTNHPSKEVIIIVWHLIQNIVLTIPVPLRSSFIAGVTKTEENITKGVERSKKKGWRILWILALINEGDATRKKKACHRQDLNLEHPILIVWWQAGPPGEGRIMKKERRNEENNQGEM